MGGGCDDKEGELNQAHMFPRVLGCKGGVTLGRVTQWRLGCIVFVQGLLESKIVVGRPLLTPKLPT